MTRSAHLLRALLPCLLLSGGALAEPRFTSVVPGSEPGSWIATVADLVGKPSFHADGRLVEAEILSGGGEQVRLRFTGLPAGTRFLGVSDGRANRPEASILLQPAGDAIADLTIYHIMVGHFANGSSANDREGMRGFVHSNYAGGDLQGVLDKVDYIADLGVNAVWLSPIFEAESSHGYDVKNYYRIGAARAVPGSPEESLALYRKLRDALHAKGIKLILDVPLNHAHQKYQRGAAGDPKELGPKMTRAKQTAEKTWESWGSPYRYWDMDDADTRRFLKDAALHWLVQEGADGLRLDYVRGVDNAFWSELYAEVKAAKPDAVLIGEAWMDEGSPAQVMADMAAYYALVEGRPQFDALFDFPVQYAVTDVFGKGGDARVLEQRMQAAEAAYGETAAGYGGRPAWFLDNHDLARLGAWAKDKDRIVAAVGMLSALSGPAVLFYGTETGLSHPGAMPGFTDAGRVRMPWSGLDQPMIEKVSSYLTLRRDMEVLRRGARLPLHAEEDVLVFAKQQGDKVALVAVNLASNERTVTVETGGLLPDTAPLQSRAGGGPAPEVRDGRIVWRLPPVSTQIAATPDT
ncbi:alpha-amylase family glycosyl hydrolase [Indioceanicola profundi]|uniref:alpha-amylase family glycosyl hydrolase n=1 Tax=Indioceanicola profundi TaxID=2220096 RepID=UPI000E6ACFFF|nr:alpha-amylase family glycosyl hydrolase [Indioceanicola profundi]